MVYLQTIFQTIIIYHVYVDIVKNPQAGSSRPGLIRLLTIHRVQNPHCGASAPCSPHLRWIILPELPSLKVDHPPRVALTQRTIEAPR